MPTYSVRDRRTGETFDIQWDLPLTPENEAAFRAEIDRQGAVRAAERAQLNDSVRFVSQFQPGSSMRREAIESQVPVYDHPASFAEAVARETGRTVAQTVPNILRSTAQSAAIGPTLPLQNILQNIQSRRTGGGFVNPLTTLTDRIAYLEQGAGNRGLRDLVRNQDEFYGYNADDLTPTQKFLAPVVGGGIGSAISILPQIYLGGPAGLLASAAGRMAPNMEESIEGGASPERAFAQAALSSGIEAGSEYALGAPGSIIRRFSGGAPIKILDKIAQPLAQNLTAAMNGLRKSAGNTLVELGIRMPQEAFEEMLSGTLTDYSAANITGTNPDALADFWMNRLGEAIGGAAGAAVFAPAMASQIRNNVADTIVDEIAAGPMPPRLDQLGGGETVEESTQGQTQGRRQALLPPIQKEGQVAPYFAEDAPLNRRDALIAALQMRDLQSQGPVYGPAIPAGRPTVDQSGVPLPPTRRESLLSALQTRDEQLAQPTVGPAIPTGGATVDRFGVPLRMYGPSIAMGFPAQLEALGMHGPAIPMGPPTMDEWGNPLPVPVLHGPPIAVGPPTVNAAGVPLTTPAPTPAPVPAPTPAPVPAPAAPATRSLPSKVRKKKEATVKKKEPRKEPELPQVEAVAPPVVAPEPEPEPEAPAPTPEEVAIANEAERSAAARPAVKVGLDTATTATEWVMMVRAQTEAIKAMADDPISTPFKFRLAQDLIDEVNRSYKRFHSGRKSERVADAVSRIQRELVVGKETNEALLETLVSMDVGQKQADYVAELFEDVEAPDVPGPEATPDEISEYEKKVALPPAKRPVASAAQVPPPWSNPTLWLKNLLTTKSRGEKRQMALRHAFVQMGDKVYLVPVYARGDKDLTDPERVMIGDPELRSGTKNRIKASDFQKKYGKTAKFLGVIGLPPSSAVEWVNQVEWTLPDALSFLERTMQQQEVEIRGNVYPATLGEEATEVSQSTILDDLAEKESPIDQINDFVARLIPDALPASATLQQVRQWAKEAYENFLLEGDARSIMRDLASVLMNNALVVNEKGKTRGVEGLPLEYAGDYAKTSQWIEDQIVEAASQSYRDIISENPGFALVESIERAQPKSRPGSPRGRVLEGARSRTAEALARRLAPAVAIPAGQLREGIRPSTAGDYESTSRTVKSKPAPKAKAAKPAPPAPVVQPLESIKGSIEAKVDKLPPRKKLPGFAARTLEIFKAMGVKGVVRAPGVGIAAALDSEGDVYLYLDDDAFSRLSPAKAAAVLDEELRHAAALTYLRDKIGEEDFAGHVGEEAERRLEEAWNSFDKTTQLDIEGIVEEVYGRKLAPANLVLETIRMAGQAETGAPITEALTRRRTRSNVFTDILEGIRDWILKLFRGKTLPQPIKELYDGAEALLALAKEAPAKTGLQEVVKPEAALVVGAAQDEFSNLDDQRLSPGKIAAMENREILNPLMQRRILEQEAAQSNLVTPQARQAYRDLIAVANAPIPPNSPADVRRAIQDQRATARKAIGELRGYENLLAIGRVAATGPSAWETFLAKGPSSLTGEQYMEATHDAAGVVAVHEYNDRTIAKLERKYDSALTQMDTAVNVLLTTLKGGKSAEVVRSRLLGQLKDIRDEVTNAILWQEMADTSALTQQGRNMAVYNRLTTLESAMEILGTDQATADLEQLINVLATATPALAGLTGSTAWSNNPDTFYDELVQRGVLQAIFAAHPNLAISRGIIAAVTPLGQTIPAPLKAYAPLRSLIESIQTHEAVRDQIVQDLESLLPSVDPAAPQETGDPKISIRRVLYRFQQRVATTTNRIARIMKVDKEFRDAVNTALAIETAMAQIKDLTGDRPYRDQVTKATRLLHRRANDIISDSKVPGVIRVLLPKGMTFTWPPGLIVPQGKVPGRQVVEIQASFEKGITEENREKLQALIGDLRTWVANNQLTADPIHLVAYNDGAIPQLEALLNPDYAINKDTIDEAGLWRFLGFFFSKVPVIKDLLHPTLRQVDESVKGLNKGILTKRMYMYVRWGLWEQSREPEWVKVRLAQGAAMKSHGMTPRLRWRDLLGDRLNEELQTYAEVIGEPLIASLQRFDAHHLDVGSFIRDYERRISPTGWIQITREDMNAVKEMARYEREIREFTEGMAGDLDPELIEAIRTEDPEMDPSQAGRTRRAFAAGPMVMSRSFGELARASSEEMLAYEQSKGIGRLARDASGSPYLPEQEKELVRNHYLRQTLRNGGSGATSPRVMKNVIMSYITATDSTLRRRSASPQLPIYDEMAKRISEGKLELETWDDVVDYVASARVRHLKDTRLPHEVKNTARKMLSSEIVEGLAELHEIELTRGTSEIELKQPKSSLNVQRGNMVASPAFYQYGIWNSYDRNSMHGGVLRHLSNGIASALKVIAGALETYEHQEANRPVGGRTTAARKKQGEVAYRVQEARDLAKTIRQAIQVEERFQEATLDPEQYYHIALRLGMTWALGSKVSAVTNPLGALHDVYKSMVVSSTLQRRSLNSGLVNWVFAPASATLAWFKSFSTVILASMASTPSGKRELRQAMLRASPWLAGRVHAASKKVYEARLAGAVRSTSFADQSALMAMAGSTSGVIGAQQFEKTAGVVAKIFRTADRLVASNILGRGAQYALGSTRTVIEDVNAMAVAEEGLGQLNELVLRGLKVLRERQRKGILYRDPADPGYAITSDDKIMGSIASIRQARTWLRGSKGMEAVLLDHLDATASIQDVEEAARVPLPPSVTSVWTTNYLTDTQVQTLREQAEVTKIKGVTGVVARFFISFKRWASNQVFRLIRRGINRNMVGRPWGNRREEMAEIMMLLAIMLAYGLPGWAFFRFLRDKAGWPQGLTLENLMRNPDLETAALVATSVLTDHIPFGSYIDSGLQGLGQGTIDVLETAPMFGSIANVARGVLAVARTSDISDPKSVLDAMTYQMGKVVAREIPIVNGALNLLDEGRKDYTAAARAVSALAPGTLEKSAFKAAIPKSPAYDNLERALRAATVGDFGTAQEEASEGIRQLIQAGNTPLEAARKWKSSAASRSLKSVGFERKPTDEEWAIILARATPEQQRAIIAREAAVEAVGAMAGGTGTGGGGSGASPYGVASGTPRSLPRFRTTQVGMTPEMRSVLGSAPRVPSRRRRSALTRLRSRSRPTVARVRSSSSRSRLRALRRRAVSAV